MLYQKTLKLFAGGGALLLLFRAVLKILVIDLHSGFYDGNLRWLGTVFSILLAFVACAIFFTAVRTPDTGMTALHGGRLLEVSAVLYGLILLPGSVPPLLDALSLDSHIAVTNSLPRWLLLIEHSLGLLSGAIMILLAFFLLSGARHGETQGVLALIPVLWQTLSMIQRFISFQQVNTDSDQLLETLFLISASLFLLMHARCLSGFSPHRGRTVAFSLLTALFGGTLAFGQLCGRAVLGPISGPSPLRLVILLATAVYAFIFALCVIRTPEISPQA